jgi:hypothetical protein
MYQSLENEGFISHMRRAANCATWLENGYFVCRIFRAAKCATWLENTLPPKCGTGFFA